MKHPIDAIFLDRDGVIIHNRARYVRSWQDVRIYPKSIKALCLLAEQLPQAKIVLITNQSAIGRGLTSLQMVEWINQNLIEQIHAAGGKIDGIYLCPHSPEDNCNCRKPRPGLIIQASQQLEISPSRSILIGDAMSDLEAGHRAGIPRLILVRTGRGNKQYPLVLESPLFYSTVIEKNLLTAVKNLLI